MPTNSLPDAIRPFRDALYAAILDFEPVTQRRGAGYVDGGAVRRIFHEHYADTPAELLGFRAKVKSLQAYYDKASPIYTTRWVLNRTNTANDANPANTTKESGISWESECSCPVKHKCKHAYAAALAVLNQADIAVRAERRAVARSAPPSVDSNSIDISEDDNSSEDTDIYSDDDLPSVKKSSAPSDASPSEPPTPPTPESPIVQSLIATLEEKHRRPLIASEIEILRHLVTYWKSGKTTLDCVELHKLGIPNTRNTIYFKWAGEIASPQKLWQCIVARYTGKHDFFSPALPAFLSPLDDSEEMRLKYKNYLREKSVREWKKLFLECNNNPQSAFFPFPSQQCVSLSAEIRLRLAPPRLVWEHRLTKNSSWASVPSELVSQWFSARDDNTLDANVLNPISILFNKIAADYHEGKKRDRWSEKHLEVHQLHFDDTRTQQLVHWLFSSPELRHLLVSKHGKPFSFPLIPLTWRAIPDEGNPEDIAIFLSTPDGVPVEMERADFLAATVAVKDENIYRLPNALQDTFSTGSTMAHSDTKKRTIPREAICTGEGHRYLYRNKVNIDKLELPGFRLVPLRPVLYVGLGGAGNFAITPTISHIIFRLQGRSEDGTHIRVLKQQSWAIERDTTPTPTLQGELVEYDTTALLAAEKHLRQFDISGAKENDTFGVRISRSFLDGIAAWCAEATRLGIELKLANELAAFARPPDTARLELLIYPIAMNLKTEAEQVSVKLVLKSEDVLFSDDDLQILLHAKGKFVFLSGKGWRRLQCDLDEAQCEALAALGLGPDAPVGKAARPRHLPVSQLADERLAPLFSAEDKVRYLKKTA